MKNLRPIFALLVLAVCTVGLVWGQAVTATLVGTITDLIHYRSRTERMLSGVAKMTVGQLWKAMDEQIKARKAS